MSGEILDFSIIGIKIAKEKEEALKKLLKALILEAIEIVEVLPEPYRMKTFEVLLPFFIRRDFPVETEPILDLG